MADKRGAAPVFLPLIYVLDVSGRALRVVDVRRLLLLNDAHCGVAVPPVFALASRVPHEAPGTARVVADITAVAAACAFARRPRLKALALFVAG